MGPILREKIRDFDFLWFQANPLTTENLWRSYKSVLHIKCFGNVHGTETTIIAKIWVLICKNSKKVTKERSLEE